MTPEGKIKAMVNKAINDTGRIWKFMPVQMGMGIPALDYLLCVNGRFVAIETKTKGKKLTTRQLLTKETIEKAGGKVFIVDDKESLDAAMRVIRGFAGFGMMEAA